MIIFDEKKYAEKLIKKGFVTKNKNVYELHILAKYYFSEGNDDIKVKELLINFCEKYIEHFNMDEWYKIINNTVNSAKKNKLIKNKEIYITEKELLCIKGLEKTNEQKVAFTLLVLYKFYDYKKFEVSIEDLYRLCKLNINSKTKLGILQSLTAKELVDITMGGKRWAKFADKKDIPVITIRNFDDFIYEYLRYIGDEKYSSCEECNRAIKLTSNRKKYCSDCWKEKEKELWRENKRKQRKGNVQV